MHSHSGRDTGWASGGYHQTYFPEVRHCPLAGQCVPLAPSPSNPPILSGWGRLTLPFHLCHASHAFGHIFVYNREKIYIYIIISSNSYPQWTESFDFSFMVSLFLYTIIHYYMYKCHCCLSHNNNKNKK